MYQQDMFSNGQFKNARFIASGCYGRVHDLGNGYVVKYAERDGTLNYLEWCYRLQQAGQGLECMPLIDSLVLLENDRYMVTMEHLGETLRDNTDDEVWSVDAYNHHELSDKHDLNITAAYLLACAFDAYMVEQYGTREGRYMKDLHGGNFMIKHNKVYLTDPSGMPYLTIPEITQWDLH